MKICVIGTSHSVCFRRGLQDISEIYPEADMTYFQNPGKYFDKFVADSQSGRLTMPDKWIRKRLKLASGGVGDIDFGAYDICLIVGGFGHLITSSLGQLGGQSQTGYSTQVIQATTRDLFQEAHVSILLPKIRALSDIPVYLIHDPITAHKKGLSLSEMENPYQPYDYDRGVTLLNDIVLAPQSAEMLPQPKETLAAPNWTKFELSVGFREPFQAEIDAGFKGKLKEDRGHMKPPFGTMQAKAFFARLGIEPVVPAEPSEAL